MLLAYDEQSVHRCSDIAGDITANRQGEGMASTRTRSRPHVDKQASRWIGPAHPWLVPFLKEWVTIHNGPAVIAARIDRTTVGQAKAGAQEEEAHLHPSMVSKIINGKAAFPERVVERWCDALALGEREGRALTIVAALSNAPQSIIDLLGGKAAVEAHGKALVAAARVATSKVTPKARQSSRRG